MLVNLWPSHLDQNQQPYWQNGACGQIAVMLLISISIAIAMLWLPAIVCAPRMHDATSLQCPAPCDYVECTWRSR